MDAHMKQLTAIVQSTPWLMEVLRTVRSINLPDWYVGAGAIRNTVWNVLSDIDSTKHHNDIDVVYYNPSTEDASIDISYQNTLNTLMPMYDWEVVNQARAYRFTTAKERNIPQATSACHGISTWVETATCVGVRLEADDTLTICAPHGLDDLMNMIARPIPPPYQSLELFRERMKQKQWDIIWPQLQIQET